MTRLIYYTATTLDGYIADPDDSLDWLMRQDQDEKGPLNYEDFIKGIGAIVMGSTTYEWILRHEPDKWFYPMPAWVMTHRDLRLPAVEADVRFAQGEVQEVHAAMVAAADGKDLWVVGGGELVGQFHDAGLLDEVLIQYAPVTVGSGAPVLPRHVELRLEEVARNRDFMCGRYSVVR